MKSADKGHLYLSGDVGHLSLSATSLVNPFRPPGLTAGVMFLPLLEDIPLDVEGQR